MQISPDSHPAGSEDTPLFDLVFQRILKSPDISMSFSDFMELALYHEGYGYYSQPVSRAIGRMGDFYTSVSVGSTFGFLLAHAIHREWMTTFGGAMQPVIVEQGAHDGRLARDVMAGLRAIDPAFAASLTYRVIEPRPSVRMALEATLASDPEGGGIEVVGDFAAAATPCGIFLCNELLDAFPVHCLLFQDGAWRERAVGWHDSGDGLAWVARPLPPFLEAFAASLGHDFPEGYHTEVCPAVDLWVEESAALFGERGLWWIIDYGYERADYYAPSRRTGTLRCYDAHRAGEDPFDSPGRQDITAHVDFTRVEEAASRAGLRRTRFTDQHHFLIEAARPWLLSIEGEAPAAATAKRLRQFQTLTHPSLMGQQFKVMELRRGS
jgi:SAM-dependent MidA family methyltransferase